MKIHELISVPRVETVIQAAQAERLEYDELRERIVESFVMTGDALHAVESIFFSLENARGFGAILKGNYGSGKSHFLAFLAAVCRFPRLHQQLIDRCPELSAYGPMLQRLRILPVSIVLTDFAASSGLSEIVIQRITAAMAEAGIEGELLDSRRLVRDFKQFVDAAVLADLDAFIRKSGAADLSEQASADQIMQFLRARNIPFRPFYDYQDFFSRLDSLLATRYPDGLLLCIDEVSEFLRARGRGDLAAEDIRFIQFLGERSQKARLGLILSMQEAIEEVAEISNDGLNRIRDRYPLRINLTAVHVRELIDRRLLVKRPESLPAIDAVHAALADSFPDWKISQDDFRSIYPVHPATVAMLEGIAGMFSKTRGMVDFIYSEIAGDESRGIRGMLDNDAHALLLPHRIFDHFRNNLAESIDHHRLVSTVYASVEREIPRLFSKPNDRDCALCLIKLILLFQILPGGDKPSARELAHLSLEARFTLDPGYNYIFVREKILRIMERECAFLGVDRGATALDDRFYFLFEENPAAVFDAKVKQFIAKNANLERQALWYFIAEMRTPDLPLADCADDSRPVAITFENTIRQGLARLMSPKRINSDDLLAVERQLNETEIDFMLFIGFPVADDGETEAFARCCNSLKTRMETVIFWRPAPPDEAAIRQLRDAYARIRVYESGQKTDDPLIADIIHQARTRSSHLVKNLYGGGAFISLREGRIQSDPVIFTGEFEKTVELRFKEHIKRVFPEHSRVMPHFTAASREVYNQIILLFRDRGEVDFAFEGSKLLHHALDGLLRNAHLLKSMQSVFRIAPEPAKNPFIKTLLYRIEQSPDSFSALYMFFRKSEYGIQRELFALYLFFLTASGFIGIERSGRALRPEAMDLDAIIDSDRIRTGEEISGLFIERFGMLDPFTRGLTAKNVHLQSQKATWDKIVAFKRAEEDRVQGLWDRLGQLSRYPLFQAYSLEKVRGSMARLRTFIDCIKVSKNSREGLDALLAAMDEEHTLAYDLDVMERFRIFLERDFDLLVFIHGYITDPNLYCAGGESPNAVRVILEQFARLDDLIIFNKTAAILDQFNEFRESYKREYIAAHKKIHSPHMVDEIEKIRLTAGYRALQNLSAIETLSVRDDLVAIDSIFRELRSAVCRRPVAEQLENRPWCDCRLSKPPAVPDPAEIGAAIRRGIAQYCAALNEDANRNKISSFMGSLLSSRDTESRDAVKAVVEADPSLPEPELLKIMNAGAIALVNRALKSNIRIVRKELRALHGALGGRRFSRQGLFAIINEWLGDAGDGSGAEIVYEIAPLENNAPQPGLPPVLVDELGRLFPGLDIDARLQLFAMAWAAFRAGNGAFEKLPAIAFMDIDVDALRPLVERAQGMVPESFDWTSVLPASRQDDLFAALYNNRMDGHALIRVFRACCGFDHIRTRIIETIVSTDITIPVMLLNNAADDSPHNALLSACCLARQGMRTFYARDGKKDGFDRQYFSAAFSVLPLISRMETLALNHNIAPGIISDAAGGYRTEIEEKAGAYFSAHIAAWETDQSMQARHMPFLAEDPASVLFIWDSLRCDLFAIVHQRLMASGIVTLWTEKILLAGLPSDTRTFREQLFGQADISSGQTVRAADREWLFVSAADRDYKKRGLWDIIGGHGGPLIIGFSFLDEQIHSSRQGIAQIADDLVSFCDQVFLPLVKNLEPGRMLYMSADHGFVERPGYDRSGQERYGHGGNSFYERVLPFAGYRRGPAASRKERA